MTALDLSEHNVVCVLYPHWAGGKSLINALGISESACLQHRFLSELQIAGKLSSKNKFDLVFDKVKASRYYWDDLSFGCIQFYGDRPEFAINQFKDYTKINPQEFLLNDRLLVQAQEKQLVIFRTIHDARAWKKFIAISNPFTIQFVNVQPVIEHRIGNKAAHDFISQQEKELSQALKHTDRNPNFVWDCEWFFDKDLYKKNLQNLYNVLNLTDFNEEWTEQLRKIYLEVWEFNRPYILTPIYNLQSQL